MRRILTAPPGTGVATLGKTLPGLLYESLERHPNPALLNQPRAAGGYEPLSTAAFVRAAEETALGLRDVGLRRGDRVALFMASDVGFCVADMGCLIAGLVDVPVYLTHTEEAIHYVFAHAEAHALFVSDADGFARVREAIRETPIETVVVAEGPLPAEPDGLTVLTLDALRARGRARRTDAAVADLLGAIGPDDLATVLYTSGTTGAPKGVMLTHENVSFNALTAFSGLDELRPGEEVVLSFLPLTHIFARTMHYGNVALGSATFFCTPEEVAARFTEVRPTIFCTVPRVLEKVHARILQKGALLTGAKRVLMDWALGLARRYRVGLRPDGRYARELAVADRLVFSKWREGLGGRIRYVIVGGAALAGELTNFFAAAGVPLLQGYGLTETSPVITFNRPRRNRAGTVGEPIPGVEVTLAGDGEILTRGPHVMAGYFKDPDGTAAVLDADGWFYTGDVGEVTEDARLRITDRKKDLFKLSTGKYVMPTPVEQRLAASPLVEQAVVVGAGQKYAAALLFPEAGPLDALAEELGLAGAPRDVVAAHPDVVARYAALVDEANEGMEPWNTVKRFRLVPEQLTVESGLLTPKLSVRRGVVRERFADEIASLYDGEEIGAELAAALKARHEAA